MECGSHAAASYRDRPPQELIAALVAGLIA
jgi:hypothetical protein